MYLKERCQYHSSKKNPLDLPGYEDSHKFYFSEESWIYFRNKRLGKRPNLDGWKFCINIDIEHLNFAWSLLEPIILNPFHGALACKVIDIENFNSERWKLPTGRQIVIYTFNDKENSPMQTPEALFSLLVKIESTLRQNNICADTSSTGSLKIKGSRYVSLRNDINPEAKTYISRKESAEKNHVSAHNPFSQFNPYEQFSMQSNEQRFFNTSIYRGEKRKLFRSYGNDEIIPIPQSSLNFS